MARRGVDQWWGKGEEGKVGKMEEVQGWEKGKG